MKKIIIGVALLLLGALASAVQAQLSSAEEALAMAKATGKSVFLLGGNES